MLIKKLRGLSFGSPSGYQTSSSDSVTAFAYKTTPNLSDFYSVKKHCWKLLISSPAASCSNPKSQRAKMPLNPYAPLYQPRQNYYYYNYNPVWLVPVVHSDPLPLPVSSLIPCEPVLPVSSLVPCEPQPACPSSTNLHFPRSSGPAFRGKRMQHNQYKGKTWKRTVAPMRVCGPRKKLDLDDGREKWVPKNKQKLQAEEKNMEASRSEHKNGGPVIPMPPTFDPSTTTVMVKNIPYHFGKIWKKTTISNLGYAFVNFTTPAAAHRFDRSFKGLKWNVQNNKNTCEVRSAKFQGKAALLKHFKNKKFWCESAEYLPVTVEPACDGSNWFQVSPVGKLTGVPPYKS